MACEETDGDVRDLSHLLHPELIRDGERVFDGLRSATSVPANAAARKARAARGFASAASHAHAGALGEAPQHGRRQPVVAQREPPPAGMLEGVLPGGDRALGPPQDLAVSL